MNKIKLLTILCIGLFITNLMLLWFLLSNKPGNHPGGEGPKKVIIEKLGFDKAQVAEYEKQIQWHRSEIDRSQEKLMKLKNELYASLTSNEDKKDSLIMEICAVQEQIENIHYKHFLDIKSLCKPEQQKAFEELTKEIARLFAPQHPPKRKEE